MATITRISSLSREYVHVPVTASRLNGVALDITADPVEIAIVPVSATVTDTDFVEAAWTTIDDAVHASVLVGPGAAPSVGAFSAGFWDVYVRLTDSPEIPVLLGGSIEIY